MNIVLDVDGDSDPHRMTYVVYALHDMMRQAADTLEPKLAMSAIENGIAAMVHWEGELTVYWRSQDYLLEYNRSVYGAVAWMGDRGVTHKVVNPLNLPDCLKRRT